MSNVAGRALRLFVRLTALPVILVVGVMLKVFARGRILRVVVLDPRLFGHQSLEPEVFWNDWQSSRESGSRDLWRCCLGKKSEASNQFLWELTRKQFPTIPSWFVTSVAYWKKELSLSNIVLVDASIYRLGFLTRRGTKLPLTMSMQDRRLEILSRFDQPRLPYVVFTVREFDRTSTNNELRNRQIADFLPAMSALNERGFNVIRLMSRTKDPLACDRGKILDWQVLDDGEPGDELAVISGASFVVSTTTGGDCLALAYRRPVLYIDSARFYLVFLATELATFQMPRIENSRSGGVLSLAQILQLGLGWIAEQESFAGAGVSVVKSTPEEIRDYVLEYCSSENWKTPDSSDASEETWRDMLLSRHGPEILKRHGQIRARMHPLSKRFLLPVT